MAAKRDIKIYQGTSFEMVLIWKDGTGTPIDVTEYTGVMKIRPEYNSEVVLANFTIQFEAEGRIVVSVSSTITGNISVSSTDSIPPIRTAYYDLIVTSPSNKATCLLYGIASIQAKIS